ncbi:MAG: hypothetical protein M3N13_06715, partial [Candidatus Eremiobacteraeota bacterium]|nr:hypothetical protein [Candidatus Eremiobacteraeota bacterium]
MFRSVLKRPGTPRPLGLRHDTTRAARRFAPAVVGAFAFSSALLGTATPGRAASADKERICYELRDRLFGFDGAQGSLGVLEEARVALKRDEADLATAEARLDYTRQTQTAWVLASGRTDRTVDSRLQDAMDEAKAARARVAAGRVELAKREKTASLDREALRKRNCPARPEPEKLAPPPGTLTPTQISAFCEELKSRMAQTQARAGEAKRSMLEHNAAVAWAERDTELYRNKIAEIFLDSGSSQTILNSGLVSATAALAQARRLATDDRRLFDTTQSTLTSQAHLEEQECHPGASPAPEAAPTRAAAFDSTLSGYAGAGFKGLGRIAKNLSAVTLQLFRGTSDAPTQQLTLDCPKIHAQTGHTYDYDCTFRGMDLDPSKPALEQSLGTRAGEAELRLTFAVDFKSSSARVRLGEAKHYFKAEGKYKSDTEAP